jgi:two-component system response regulator FlrC
MPNNVASDPGEGLRIGSVENFTDSARHILIVDDEFAILDAMSLILEADGYACTSAFSGIQALAAIEKDHTIRGVITDLNMPEMDGMELIQHLRQERPYLPIMVCSGNVSERNHQVLKEWRVPILLKPFTLVQLLDRVSELVKTE